VYNNNIRVYICVYSNNIRVYIRVYSIDASTEKTVKRSMT
jgi:hypothetical protein